MSRILNTVKKLGLVTYPFGGGQMKTGPELTPNLVINSVKPILHKMKLNVYDTQTHNSHFYETNNVASIGAKIDSVVQYNQELYKNCLKSLHNDDCTLIVGGDHSQAIGSVTASLQYDPSTFVVWVDAHADINTYNSSPSKNMHGMPLSIVSKLDDVTSNFFSWINDTNKLNLNRLFYIGLRDLDSGEVETINNKKIKSYFMDDVKSKGINNILSEISLYIDRENIIRNDCSDKNTKIHLSLDVDSLDPSFMPSTGTSVDNGLNLDEVKNIISHFKHSYCLKAIDLTEINFNIGSEEDKNTTLNNSVELIKHLCYH